MTALANRLKAPDRPDAVFVLDDFLVPYVAQTISEAGLSVPNDVAIVAFGNDVPYYFGEPALTTVSMDWDKVADATAKLVLSRLNGDLAPVQTIALPVELITRGSCGAPKTEWSKEPFYTHINSLAYAMPETNTGYQPVKHKFSPDQFKAEGNL